MEYGYLWRILLGTLYLGNVNGDLFTATADLKQLLKTEELFINSLQDYIKLEEERVQLIKNYINTHQEQREHANAENAISAFSLIKRLTVDKEKIDQLMQRDIREEYIINMTRINSNEKFPSREDLKGAAMGLIRLQNVYQLNSSLMATGELNGVQYDCWLTPSDCFELGKQMFLIEDLDNALLFMKEANEKLKAETDSTIDRSSILDFLQTLYYEKEKVVTGLDLTLELLEISAIHSKTNINQKEDLKKKLDITKARKISAPDSESNYARLCRGDIAEKFTRLKCYYLSRNNPFLLIAPFKVEEAHLKPDILVFHNAITDGEISTFKQLSQPKYKRAEVLSPNGSVPHDARIGKSTILAESAHIDVKTVNQRSQDMTGLTMSTAEPCSVINYGIGGHYEPHYDFLSKDIKSEIFERLGNGNRVASLVFFLSDVEQGGSTVFPKIDVYVRPRKGSAIFWHNLHPSGDGDILTVHGGCPVLVGSKWIIAKFIHEVGQEFLRPCTLERPAEHLTI